MSQKRGFKRREK